VRDDLAGLLQLSGGARHNRDMSPQGREPDGNLTPNSAAGAGDERHATLQAAWHWDCRHLFLLSSNLEYGLSGPV
jgi:hypothetical protein